VRAAAAADAPARGQFPYDAILVVGGKPEGLEVPGLDLALRARKGWELLDQARAYTVLLSGNEYNNRSMVKTTGFRPRDEPQVDLSKLPRIKSAEMLALMLNGRQVGRLAMRLRADPHEAVAYCKEQGWKKILAVGDGAGPERSAVEELKAAGLQVDFAPVYDPEEGKKLLAQDLRLTPQERAKLRLDYVKPEEVHILLVKGGGNAVNERLLTAVRLYQSGIGKYIMPAGGGGAYIHAMAEAAPIICGGFGIPHDRIVYGPGVKSTYNFANAKLFAKKLGLQQANVYCPQGGSPTPGGDVKFWDVGMVPYEVRLPRDHAARVKAIMAEVEEEAARCQRLIQTGTPAERAEAQARLKYIGPSKYGQRHSILFNLNVRGNCGRNYSFPKMPWDWDGYSLLPGYELVKVVDLLRGNLGVVDFKNIGPAVENDPLATSRKYVRVDYGVKGPWQKLMDARIEPDRGSPAWWDKVEAASKGARRVRKKTE
jgi:hypothetical protein